LLTGHLRYDFGQPDNPANDHLIFSKGHASPLVYAMFKAAGAISDDELMTFRKFRSRLEGHPTPILPWVDVATGSLGQGLPIGVDGHHPAEIDDAYGRARAAGRPTAILARTVKGKGVSFLENKEGWHGKALDPEQAKQAIAELGGETRSRTFAVAKPERWDRPSMQRSGSLALKTYTEPIATRKAYGEALAALGAARKDVVVLDAE